MLALGLLLFFYLTCFAVGQWHPSDPAQYHPLPSLQEQALIRDQWTSERVARIPLLLQKYNAQAWLVMLFYLVTHLIHISWRVSTRFANENTQRIRFGGLSRTPQTSTLTGAPFFCSTPALYLGFRIH